MAILPADCRDAVRSFRSRPGFALLIVLTLAVGMSVNTVAFSVVNALLFKLPVFADFDRLGWIFVGGPGHAFGEVSFAQYETLRTRATSLDAVIAEGRLPVRVTRAGLADQAWALVVSHDYFEVLGVRPAVGRVLATGDGDEPVAMVSHEYWSSRLGQGDPGSIVVVLNDQEFTVVGVLPAGFHGPGGIYAPDVWVSLRASHQIGLSRQLTGEDHAWLTLVGRRRSAQNPAQVAAELDALLADPDSRSDGRPRRRARFAPMPDGHPELRELRPAAVVAMGVVGVVLAIACFNVAGLLSTRATERRREIAMRAALGASGWRLVRQLATESLLFAAMAGVLALGLSAASGRLLGAFSLPAPIPQQIDLSPDARSVIFTIVLVLVATILPAVVPARLAARLDLRQVLASESGSTPGGWRRAGGRQVSQMLQIAGATTFLALAALFTASFHHMLVADPGFDTRGVLVVTADPNAHGRAASEAERFFQTLAARLRADARVRQAAVTTGIPYSVGSSRQTPVGANREDCRVNACGRAEAFVVDPGYLTAMGIRLLAGRDLSERDRRRGGGVLVGRTWARQAWPGRNPLGETISLGSDGDVAEVVGVVTDVGSAGLGRRVAPHLYRAIRTDDYTDSITLVVGTIGDPALLTEWVRREAMVIDATLPLQSVQTMAEHLRLPLWPGRLAAWFLGVCGVVALALATVGLLGVVSFGVAQRTREFGIRMALGASPRAVVRLVVTEGGMIAAAGTAIGLAGGALAATFASSALVGVSALAAGPYLVAAGLQGAVALLACFIPARRAAAIDPMAAIGGFPGR